MKIKESKIVINTAIANLHGPVKSLCDLIAEDPLSEGARVASNALGDQLYALSVLNDMVIKLDGLQLEFNANMAALCAAANAVVDNYASNVKGHRPRTVTAKLVAQLEECVTKYGKPL